MVLLGKMIPVEVDACQGNVHDVPHCAVFNLVNFPDVTTVVSEERFEIMKNNAARREARDEGETTLTGQAHYALCRKCTCAL